MESIADFVKRAIPPKRDCDYAYQMGYDCEMNGANDVNCHFSIFSSKENTAAWEAGKRDAATAKQEGKVE